jgi:hypothetical protein
MKFVASLFLVAALLVTTSFVQAADNPLVAKLQDVSVTVKSGRSQGSGCMFTRKVGNDTVTYIWTAGHVVDNLRKTRVVIINGTPKAVVEFEDAQVVQEFRQDGRRIGEINMEARVLRYSDAEQGEDLALLEVRKRNFVPAETTIEFYDGAEIPPLGTELYHVGSLLGQFGSNSLTTGVMSQQGRVLDLGANGVVFDQTTVTAFPGSSGGGVFLKSDGKYIGMLVRGAGEQFNFIVPVRRLRAWAKSAKVEWAIDQKVALPSAEELKKLPIEDAGVDFGSSADKAAGKHGETNKNFPYLIKTIPTPAAPKGESSPKVDGPSALKILLDAVR